MPVTFDDPGLGDGASEDEQRERAERTRADRKIPRVRAIPVEVG